MISRIEKLEAAVAELVAENERTKAAKHKVERDQIIQGVFQEMRVAHRDLAFKALGDECGDNRKLAQYVRDFLNVNPELVLGVAWLEGGGDDQL